MNRLYEAIADRDLDAVVEALVEEGRLPKPGPRFGVYEGVVVAQCLGAPEGYLTAMGFERAATVVWGKNRKRVTVYLRDWSLLDRFPRERTLHGKVRALLDWCEAQREPTPAVSQVDPLEVQDLVTVCSLPLRMSKVDKAVYLRDRGFFRVGTSMYRGVYVTVYARSGSKYEYLRTQKVPGKELNRLLRGGEVPFDA